MTDYDQLFEELMRYTDFTDANEIQNKGDLNSFLGQVFNDAQKPTKDSTRISKGKQRFFTQKGKTNIFNALNEQKFGNLPTGKPRHEERQVEKLTTILESRKYYKNYKQAFQNKQTVENKDRKQVYKTKIVIKGKTRTRWKDARGRFAKPPWDS